MEQRTKLQKKVSAFPPLLQVAGRLHVEVMRISGEIGERIAGGDDAAEISFDKETQESKLVCMVSPSFILKVEMWLLKIVGIQLTNTVFFFFEF